MLTERQKLILQVVVDDYVSSAEPVGSRTISKRNDISFSPATIRNVMSDLEEMGFLTQPHTSAGRIPSEKGYRFYVDHVMPRIALSLSMIRRIQRMYAEQFGEFEQAIQHTASVLSSMTNYTSIVLGPEVFNTTLQHVQLLPMGGQSAVAIIVTNTGHVENRKITVPEGISVEEMEKLVNILNAKLVGVPLFHLTERLYNEVSAELKKHMKHYREATQMMQQALSSDREDRVFLGGTTNIFSQPEFRDVEKIKGLFELLEQHERIHHLLSNKDDLPGIQVRIGRENEEAAMADCSVISATYSIGGRPVGTLNILGPTRMQYPRVISILEYLSHDLNHLLTELNDKNK